jgi:hypothetical protein
MVGPLLVKALSRHRASGDQQCARFIAVTCRTSQRGIRDRTIPVIAKIFTTASEHTAFLPPAGGCHFITQTKLRYRPTKPKLIRVRTIVLTVLVLLLVFVVCVGVGVG